jgi:hypothetical protein
VARVGPDDHTYLRSGLQGTISMTRVIANDSPAIGTTYFVVSVDIGVKGGWTALWFCHGTIYILPEPPLLHVECWAAECTLRSGSQ